VERGRHRTRRAPSGSTLPRFFRTFHAGPSVGRLPVGSARFSGGPSERRRGLPPGRVLQPRGGGRGTARRSLDSSARKSPADPRKTLQEGRYRACWRQPVRQGRRPPASGEGRARARAGRVCRRRARPTRLPPKSKPETTRGLELWRRRRGRPPSSRAAAATALRASASRRTVDSSSGARGGYCERRALARPSKARALEPGSTLPQPEEALATRSRLCGRPAGRGAGRDR